MTQENLKKLLEHFKKTENHKGTADILSKYPALKVVEPEVSEVKSKKK